MDPTPEKDTSDPILDMESKKAAIYWIAVKHQQNFYELSSDWIKYNQDDMVYLRNYIGYALFGPPKDEESLEDNGAYIYDEKQTVLLNSIFDKVKEHGIQLSDNSIMFNILYACLYDENTVLKCDFSELQDLVYIKPIFKVNKNIKTSKDTEYQSWYVDIDSRVYKTWEGYLTNSNMPPCTMIVPKDGKYQSNLKEIWAENESYVYVDKWVRNDNKTTRIIDNTSSVVGLGTAGITLAAPFVPIIGPSVLLACGIAGGISAAWCGGRAGAELYDRKQHDQSLITKDAIPAWLGFVGSAVGGLQAGGSYILSRAIRTGTTVSTSARVAHDVLTIGNVAINGVGAGYSAYNLIRNYESASMKDLFFLGTHIFFVAHSVINIRLAKTIVQSDQRIFLEEYESSLRSNRHRREYRRLVRNTAPEAVNEIHKNEAVIRTLNNISNKDEFYACLARNRKVLAGSTLSFTDGQLKIDNRLISPSEFAALSKDSLQQLLSRPNLASTTTLSGTKSNFAINGLMLKNGIKSVRDFCVRNSISYPKNVDDHIRNYQNILSDISNFSNFERIMDHLLSASNFLISNDLNSMLEKASETILPLATTFIWDFIKINLRKIIPGFHITKEREGLIEDFVKDTCENIRRCTKEWMTNFAAYLEACKSQRTSGEPVFTKSPQNQNDLQSFGFEFCDIDLLDLSVLLDLPIEEIQEIIFEMLKSSGSNLGKKNQANKELLNMCNKELNEFYEKHPVSLNFKIENVSSSICDIISDLETFNSKEIIFYKLIVLCANMSGKISEYDTIEKDTFLDVMKCLWLFTLLNFSQNVPHLTLRDKDAEYYIMNTIINIYWDWTNFSHKWIEAFYFYRENFNSVSTIHL